MTETSQHATAYMCRQWRPATAYTKDAKSHCLLLAPGLHVGRGVGGSALGLCSWPITVAIKMKESISEGSGLR